MCKVERENTWNLSVIWLSSVFKIKISDKGCNTALSIFIRDGMSQLLYRNIVHVHMYVSILYRTGNGCKHLSYQKYNYMQLSLSLNIYLHKSICYNCSSGNIIF